MNIKSIQDIFPFVERPSRYLGTEINSVKKDLLSVKLRFALVFPDLYEIGTSHFGLRILYDILNSQKNIAAERVFSPASDMESYLRSNRITVSSLESRLPLDRFDIIGFSLLYELNYTNVLGLLDLAGLPFFASKRDDSHPFIIAGGPCAYNPEPVADFFDAILIGDGEEAVLEISHSWMEWKDNPPCDRDELLKIWSKIKGVYIPSFFKPGETNGKKVTRAVIGDLDKAPFPDAPVVSYGKPVHDRLRLEVSRGCTRGCRFCQAGMIYRPVRERSPGTLLDMARQGLASTGYEDLSLLSLSTGDYSCIAGLMKQLMDGFEHVAVSLPSLRAGTLTPELMNLIKKVRKTGFTIAPEAGSARLRQVINKNVSEEDVVTTVSDAFNLGWQVIKLYFMIGLPTETDEDIKAIVELVDRLRKIKGPKGRKGKINVSVGTFVPKSHTPFQWAGQNGLEESRKKIEFLKRELRFPGINVKWQNPEVSLIEGLWARGDRSLSSLLVSAYEKGCRFDGWSDRFRYELWKEASLEQNVDIGFHTRARKIDEPLPWDHIDSGVSKDFLKEEMEKSLTGESTPDCRDGDCQDCNACDFTTVQPVVHKDFQEKKAVTGKIEAAVYKDLEISYSKTRDARVFGHLEMVDVFFRAIRRAGIKVKY